MASRVTRQELLESEFEVLATRDPEVFFEAMLISIRSSTLEPLDNAHLAYQKKVFKKWFTLYNASIREEIQAKSDDYSAGMHAGELKALTNLPTRAVTRGVLIDMKKVYDRIKELEG